MNQDELIAKIDELRALPKETEWVEFKLNKAIPENIGKYLSGLANAACLEGRENGFLVFGIEDGTHNIVGTQFHPLTRKIKNQELDNWLRTHLNPRTDFTIHEFDYRGKHIALFIIDAASGIPARFKNNAFVRVGSYLKELKDHPEKEAKIWRTTKRIVFEEEIARKNVSASQVIEFLNWQALFYLLKLPEPNDNKIILEKLLQEDLIKKRGAKYHITNLGAILFANDLGDFDGLGRKAPRVITYSGSNRLKTLKDQIAKYGLAVGFSRMIDYINERLPSNEEIGRVFRKEVRVYPELAIRELVANAIIHQDLSISGTSPMIEIFNNRIEITNPGKPLIDTQRFIDHSPISRNEKLAALMRRMNFCEERGSGIDKVIAQVEIFQLPAPDFIGGENYTRVILYSPKSLRQMDRLEKVRATYQHCCLKYVSGEMMTNQSLRERFNIEEKNYSMVSRIIKESIHEEFIKAYDISSSSKKFAKYIPYWA